MALRGPAQNNFDRYQYSILGPAIGAWLYGIGGFMLPFFSVGFVCLVLSALMIVIIPSNPMKNKNVSEMKPLVAQTSFELRDPPDTESSGPVDIT